MGGALSNVASLQGFVYTASELAQNSYGYNFPQPTMSGLSAQDVLKFAPEIVNTKGFKLKDKDGVEEEFMSLDYSGMVPYFVEAIKELKSRVEQLEDLTKSLKTV